MVAPLANSASASRSLRMICSGVCFFDIARLLPHRGSWRLSYHLDHFSGSRPTQQTLPFQLLTGCQKGDQLTAELRQILTGASRQEIAVADDRFVVIDSAAGSEVIANVRCRCRLLAIQRARANQELRAVPDRRHRALLVHESACDADCLLPQPQ